MTNKIILIVITGYFFTFCTARKTIAPEQNQIPEKIIISGATREKSDSVAKETFKKETENIRNISGNVVFTNSYCGGVRPSQEILDECKKEFPLVNSTILFKNVKAKSNSIEITTDNKGNFSTPLEVGTYNYYMTASYNKTMGCSFTSTCDIWLKRCFGQVIIVDGLKEGYKIVYNFGCNPCEPKRP